MRCSRRSDPHDGVRALKFCTAVYAAILVALLSACTVQLAPDYDKSVVDGLTSANQQVLTFFASISDGTTPATFSNRDATYATLIGKFNALQIEAAARPNPQPLFLKYLGFGGAGDKPIDPADQLKAPTPGILANIVTKLTEMRAQDKSGPLASDVIAIFKNSYTLSITQALTYEKALQR